MSPEHDYYEGDDFPEVPPGAWSKEEKVRENRLRRMARRQRLHLVKSRARDPRSVTFARWLVCNENNVVLAEWIDIDGVERFLLGED